MTRANELTDRSILERIRRYTLMDDVFMQQCFQGNREAAETVLRVIMEKPDLSVTDVATQKTLKNPFGRSVCLDIAALDGEGRAYNIEIQRETAGASPERARLHSSLMDAWLARPGKPFGSLPETWVIFITATDALGRDKPLYLFERRESTGEALGDGSRIAYVNGEKREGDTALARLMHDFFCADPDEMYYPALAKITRHFKQEEEGVRKMYSEIARLEGIGEQRGLEKGEKRGRKLGRKEGRIEEKRSGAARMIAMGKYSIEEVAQVFDLGMDQVRAIAANVAKGRAHERGA